MNRFIVYAITALASAALPSVTFAGGCGDGDCSVGHFGQGGASSDGKAQGQLTRFPSTIFPGETVTNTGNANAGHIDVTNQGSISGTVRDGTAFGHGTGIFGDWSGQCDDPFGDPDAC